MALNHNSDLLQLEKGFIGYHDPHVNQQFFKLKFLLSHPEMFRKFTSLYNLLYFELAL